MQSDVPDGLQAEAASDLVARLLPPEVARKVLIVVNRDWRSERLLLQDHGSNFDHSRSFIYRINLNITLNVVQIP